jgi:hypothetical protein
MYVEREGVKGSFRGVEEMESEIESGQDIAV